jgi:hypothetical protein
MEGSWNFRQHERTTMFYPSLFAATISSQNAEMTAMGAQQTARNAEHAADMLRCDVDRLLMITEALWTFIKQQHGYQDEDLAKLITEIDLRDGKLDGRVAPTEPRTCPSCGRVLSKNRPVCLYCGKPAAVVPFER